MHGYLSKRLLQHDLEQTVLCCLSGAGGACGAVFILLMIFARTMRLVQAFVMVAGAGRQGANLGLRWG